MVTPFDIYQAIRSLRALGFFVHKTQDKRWFLKAPNLHTEVVTAEELLQYTAMVRRSFVPACPPAYDPWCPCPPN